jgi:hypothetical protein
MNIFLRLFSVLPYVGACFAMGRTMWVHVLRWVVLCGYMFCDGSYYVGTCFAMGRTMWVHVLRWVVSCPSKSCTKNMNKILSKQTAHNLLRF